ncbi:MAG: hypothetical protein OXH89_03950 [bacterium]|nr:hypothetical protein [bacterium]
MESANSASHASSSGVNGRPVSLSRHIGVFGKSDDLAVVGFRHMQEVAECLG